MKFSSRWWLNTFSAIGFLLIAGCATAAPVDESASRISVTFVEPEKFTEARRAELQPTSSGALRALEKFLIDAGTRYVPEIMKLNIRVTDIDLAGDFELFRGPQADQVRITQGLYPPRIALEFRVADAAGQTVKEGKRDLTDIDYQLRVAYPRDDYLRDEFRQHDLRSLLQVRPRLRRRPGAPRRHSNPSARRLRRRLRRAG